MVIVNGIHMERKAFVCFSPIAKLKMTKTNLSLNSDSVQNVSFKKVFKKVSKIVFFFFNSARKASAFEKRVYWDKGSELEKTYFQSH